MSNRVNFVGTKADLELHKIHHLTPDDLQGVEVTAERGNYYEVCGRLILKSLFEKPVRHCIDCRWYSHNSCTSPDCYMRSIHYLIDGRRSVLCIYARANDGPCGYEGRHYDSAPR